MRKDILIVDDDPSIRATLKGVLEDEGYNVVAVEDGLKAIEMVKARPFSLVLTDMVMAGLSGVDLVQEIKKISPTEVVVMTGHVDREDFLMKAGRLGVRGVLYKPIQLPQLLRLVRSILAEEEPWLLVVDDDDSACKTLAGILADSGYWVETAQDGQSAIEMARRFDYRLIFMDVKMPGLNGFQAMKEIKKVKPQIPIVLFTGHRLEDFMEKSNGCGARATIRKPFNVEEILKLTKEILTEKP